jgi:hypothetical protein
MGGRRGGGAGSFSLARNDQSCRRSMVEGDRGENGRKCARIELRFQPFQLIPSDRGCGISSSENCIYGTLGP